METEKWRILCPACGGKTRNRIREDTLLLNYPLYCPKCKRETLIAAKNLRITVVERPDAQTQGRWIREISRRSPAYSFALIWIVRPIKKRSFGGLFRHAYWNPSKPVLSLEGFLCAGLLWPPCCWSEAAVTYIAPRSREDNLLKKSSAAHGTLTPLK